MQIIDDIRIKKELIQKQSPAYFRDGDFFLSLRMMIRLEHLYKMNYSYLILHVELKHSEYKC